MAHKNVLKMGEEGLYRPSHKLTEAEFNTAALRELLTDLKETMHARQGVGIAAPQIGCHQCVMMFGFEKSQRYPHEKPVPFTILINPEIEILSDEMIEAWEGCLSVPGLRGLVPRHASIRYRGFNEFGQAVEQEVSGFHARIVQHEWDHLNGILFVSRVKDLHDLGFEDALWERIYGQKFPDQNS